MTDTVDTIVMLDGPRNYAARFTNISDGTGEAGVVKIDKSTLSMPIFGEPGKLTIDEIEWNIQGFSSIRLFWDHAAASDSEIDVLSGQGYKDYRGIGGLTDPVNGDGTGDVILSTAGAAAGATYDITIHARKRI